MEFRLLGPVEAVGGDGLPIALGQRPRTVLALLLLDANEVVSTDRLIEGIWSEAAPPASAAGSLQVNVHALRKAIGPERIVTRSPGYAIRVEPDELDVLRFERLAAEGRRALQDGDAAGASASLADALALWRGPALADYRYASFARTEAQRLEEARLAALEARIEADLQLGRHTGLVAELEALVAEHPLRERLRGQLMLALYRSGRQADALAAYQEARRVLVEELGIDPSPELRELEQAILRQDPALAAAPAVAAAAGRADDDLIGRELEVTAVAALLGRPDTRLVTLTGTGGTGKTRLARAVAAQHAHSVFVDLAPVTDPSLVLSTIARTLQVEEHDERPLLDEVGQALDGSRLLLLDNLEHLPDAFPLVADLLAAAPAQSILATSRVPLRLATEHEYRVPPLPTPPLGAVDPAALGNVASVRLYCERARSALPAFELVGENSDAVVRICRALDGLPLAIELAAARVRVLGPEGTAKRLGETLALLTRSSPDLPERQRSLRATIDWSYDLLDADAQQVFRVLGAFAGGVSLDGVESIARDDLDVPTALETLLDAGLVTSAATAAGEPRFGMLETIREYALAKLETAGEADDVHGRHLDYFLQLVDGALAVRARDPGRYEREVTALDRDNFRAALDHAVASGDADALLALTAGLMEFWRTNGAIEEGRLRYLDAVARSAGASARGRARALYGLALFTYIQGDVSASVEILDEHREDFELHLQPGDLARLLWLRAAAANILGEATLAEQLLDRTVALLDEEKDERVLGRVLCALSETNRKLGNLDAAQRHAQVSADIAGRVGDTEYRAFALVHLSSYALERGDLVAARESLAEALRTGRQLADLETIAIALVFVAELAHRSADDEVAAQLLGASHRTFHDVGPGRWEIEREYWEPLLAELDTGLGTGELERVRAEGERLEPDEGASLALDWLAGAQRRQP